MQFLTSLIGGSGNMYLNAAMALGIVLLLIVLGLWALKLVFRASTGTVRGRNRRLAIVNSMPVDARRQLLIIRRDNVEHLILTGGPQDLVVETGIAAEAPQAAAQPRQGGQGPRRPTPVPAPPVVAPVPRAPGGEPAGGEAAPAPIALGRLRDLAQPAGPRRLAGLRHPGLLRTVVRSEPALVPANADNSPRLPANSATTGRVAPVGGAQGGSGQAFGRDGDPNAGRDEGYRPR